MGNYFVYFMLSRIEGQPAIKIGVSWKPKLRAVAIRRKIRDRVLVLGNYPLPSAYEAYEYEKYLHQCFRPDRIRGEWFAPSAPLLALVDKSTCYPIDPWGRDEVL